MFRQVIACLAKKKVAPPAHRKPLRRGSSAAGGRGASSRRGAARASPSRRLTSKSSTRSAAAAAATRQSGETALAIAAATAADGGASQIPQVVDIVSSRPSYRLATAVSTVLVPPAANAALEGMKQILTPAVQRRAELVDGSAGAASGPVTQMEEYYTSKKGPLFATAVIAGTNAVKQASTMIPFCHPTPIHKCSFTFRRRLVPQHALRPSALPHQVVLRKRSSAPSPVPDKAEYSVLYCFCTVATEDFKSGVEMEALTGATMASITLYDMLKTLPGAQEDGLGLGEAFILAKRGGKNDFIKLLVSEPDRPATTAAQALVSGGSSSNTTSAGDAEVALKPTTPAALPDASAAAEEGEDEEGSEPTTEAAAPSSDRAARRVQVKQRGSSGGDGRAEADAGEGTAGDAGAWWRTSKQERRLHEQFPRRKYGADARVTVPTAKARGTEPTGAPKRGTGKRQSDDEALAERDEVTADAEEEHAAEEEEEAEEEEPTKAPRKAGSHAARKDAKKKAETAKGSSRSHVDEAEQGDDDEDAAELAEDEEEQDVAVRRRKGKASHAAKGARKTATSRGAKASAHAEEDDDVPADEEDEDAAPVSHASRGKKKAGAAVAPPSARKGAKVTGRARHEAADDDEEAQDEHDDSAREVAEEEEEEEPVRTKASKAANHAATAAGKKKKKLVTSNKVSQNIRRAKAPEPAEEDADEETFEQVDHDWGNETVVEEEQEEDEEPAPAPPAKKKKILKKKKRGSR